MTNLPLKAVFPGKYIQGERALEELPGIISLFGKKCLLLASPTAKSKILPLYNLNEIGIEIFLEEFAGECCEKELNRLAEIIKLGNIDVVAGMGGGKAIDTAKIAADRAALPVIIIPTIASTDAPCSGCAVVYTEDGVVDYVYYQKLNPQVVLVDMNIIANAPARFLVAGMGDALATWFEARSCGRSKSPNECGGYATLTGLSLAKLCYDTLLNYGKAAKIANDGHIVTPALHHIVEANTLLSGLGFESAGLASAHAIHNGFTALAETHAYYHGEKVAFGLLVGLHLTGADAAEMETVYAFCEDVGLPTTLAGIGLEGISQARLMLAANRSCAPAESIHKEAVPVTPETVLGAMLTADAMGRKRKMGT